MPRDSSCASRCAAIRTKSASRLKLEISLPTRCATRLAARAAPPWSIRISPASRQWRSGAGGSIGKKRSGESRGRRHRGRRVGRARRRTRDLREASRELANRSPRSDHWRRCVGDSRSNRDLQFELREIRTDESAHFNASVTSMIESLDAKGTATALGDSAAAMRRDAQRARPRRRPPCARSLNMAPGPRRGNFASCWDRSRSPRSSTTW